MRYTNYFDADHDPEGFQPDPLGRLKVFKGGGKSPEPPPPPPPPAPPPAEEKDPNVDEMVKKKKSEAAITPPLQNTMLTGAEGIDQNSLNLGKNSLLGG